MRFLLDANMPRAAAVLLERSGHDTVHVRDTALKHATDQRISEFARTEERVIVTAISTSPMCAAIHRRAPRDTLSCESPSPGLQRRSSSYCSAFWMCAAWSSRFRRTWSSWTLAKLASARLWSSG